MSEQELTFLTDIERSTGLVRTLGSEYCDVLTASRARLRLAAASFDGREIECRPTEYFSVFDSPAAAVEAPRGAALAPR